MVCMHLTLKDIARGTNLIKRPLGLQLYSMLILFQLSTNGNLNLTRENERRRGVSNLKNDIYC